MTINLDPSRLFRDPLKGSTSESIPLRLTPTRGLSSVCLCRGTRPPQLSHRVADRRKGMLELRLCERFKLNSAILDAEASSAYLALKILSAVSKRNGMSGLKAYSYQLLNDS